MAVCSGSGTSTAPSSAASTRKTVRAWRPCAPCSWARWRTPERGVAVPAAGAPRSGGRRRQQQAKYGTARGAHTGPGRGGKHLCSGAQAFGGALRQQLRQRLGGLVARELVGLRQQYVARQAGGGAKRQHRAVELLQRVADVDNEHQAAQAAALVQISVDLHLPVLAHGLWHLGVAVARQVDQAQRWRRRSAVGGWLRQGKHHHLLGASGRPRGARQALVVGERIER